MGIRKMELMMWVKGDLRLVADTGEAGTDSSGHINLAFEQSDDILHTPSQVVLFIDFNLD